MTGAKSCFRRLAQEFRKTEGKAFKQGRQRNIGLIILTRKTGTSWTYAHDLVGLDEGRRMPTSNVKTDRKLQDLRDLQLTLENLQQDSAFSETGRQRISHATGMTWELTWVASSRRDLSIHRKITHHLLQPCMTRQMSAVPFLNRLGHFKKPDYSLICSNFSLFQFWVWNK